METQSPQALKVAVRAAVELPMLAVPPVDLRAPKPVPQRLCNRQRPVKVFRWAEPVGVWAAAAMRRPIKIQDLKAFSMRLKISPTCLAASAVAAGVAAQAEAAVFRDTDP